MLCGILFVLYTAIPWEYLSQELRFGSGTLSALARLARSVDIKEGQDVDYGALASILGKTTAAL